jgi:hypothetical protein
MPLRDSLILMYTLIFIVLGILRGLGIDTKKPPLREAVEVDFISTDGRSN